MYYKSYQTKRRIDFSVLKMHIDRTTNNIIN